MVWVGIGEASKRLGISVEGVRQRIRRGSLEAEKRDGEWLIYFADEEAIHETQQPVWDKPYNVGADVGATVGPVWDDVRAQYEARLEEMQSYIERLENDKEHLRDELRRKDTILMALTQRVPLLESSENSQDAQAVFKELETLRQEVAATKEMLTQQTEETRKREEERDLAIVEKMKALLEEHKQKRPWWKIW